MDIVLSVPSIPKPGETLSATTKTLHPGGKGANQTIAAARAGASTFLIGAVGDDPYGTDLLANLEDNQVDVTCVETWKNTDTGQAYVNVAKDGENAIVVVPGANHVFAYPLKEPKQISVAKVRLSQLEMPIPAIRAFFANARSDDNAQCILNAAPALPEAKGLFPFCDVIVVNEIELEVFSEAQSDDASDISALASAARSLLTRPDQKLVVTLGAAGSLVVAADAEHKVPTFPAKVIDTTGAGDCFCGVLAALLRLSFEVFRQTPGKALLKFRPLPVLADYFGDRFSRFISCSAGPVVPDMVRSGRNHTAATASRSNSIQLPPNSANSLILTCI